MKFEVLNKPIYATIVGESRVRHNHLGIKVGGAMDEYGFFMANKLLQNNPYDAMIEINFPNFTFKTNSDTTITVTGARCDLTINNKPKNMWQTIDIRSGDIVHIGKIIDGLRVYIAVDGGFETVKQVWGISDKMIQKGDMIEFKKSKSIIKQRLKRKFIPKYEMILTLRVMLSYQYKDFDLEELDKFFNSSYIVSNEINNMGYKLNGKAIRCKKDGVISQGISFGAIQIPKDGMPIVLLKHRQTIGGYPKIGVVLDVDCFKLSQAKPNTKIIFEKIGFKEATKISKKFKSICTDAS